MHSQFWGKFGGKHHCIHAHSILLGISVDSNTRKSLFVDIHSFLGHCGQ